MEIGDNFAYVLIILLFVGALVGGGYLSERDANTLKIEQEKTKRLELKWKQDSLKAIQNNETTFVDSSAATYPGVGAE